MTTSLMGSGKECSHAWELMPWVLQGHATEEQSEWLMNHVVQCESCSAEFAQQSRLRLAMSLPADIPLDPEVGLQRLMDRIDAPESSQAANPSRLRAGHWMTRALVAAVLIQAIGIGILGSKLSSTNEAPKYRTLSDASLPVAPGAIRVVPEATMTLADWDALLHNLGLQIAGGPNDAGAYTVVPVQTLSTAQHQHTLQQLRAARGIRLAEPIASP